MDSEPRFAKVSLSLEPVEGVAPTTARTYSSIEGRVETTFDFWRFALYPKFRVQRGRGACEIERKWGREREIPDKNSDFYRLLIVILIVSKKTIYICVFIHEKKIVASVLILLAMEWKKKKESSKKNQGDKLI